MVSTNHSRNTAISKKWSHLFIAARFCSCIWWKLWTPMVQFTLYLDHRYETTFVYTSLYDSLENWQWRSFHVSGVPPSPRTYHTASVINDKLVSFKAISSLFPYVYRLYLAATTTRKRLTMFTCWKTLQKAGHGFDHVSLAKDLVHAQDIP